MGSSNEEFANVARFVEEFRRWALSDRTNPMIRGLLAEYFVRRATNTDKGSAEDWNYVDIECEDGMTIEVKSSACLQPRRGKKMVRATPRFGIGKKQWAWSNRTWDWLCKPGKPKRWAEIYVFCLENETVPEAYNPYDLSQWEFFVILTSSLDDMFPEQKTVSAERLRQKGFNSVSFEDLHDEIKQHRRVPDGFRAAE